MSRLIRCFSVLEKLPIINEADQIGISAIFRKHNHSPTVLANGRIASMKVVLLIFNRM